MPAFPEVGSTTSLPGRSVPARRPFARTWLATRSFTLPLGLRYSSFTHTPSMRTSGVGGREAAGRSAAALCSGWWFFRTAMNEAYRPRSGMVKKRPGAARRLRSLDESAAELEEPAAGRRGGIGADAQDDVGAGRRQPRLHD